MVLSFAVISLGSAEAEAACGCSNKWDTCISAARKAHSVKKAKPGTALKTMKARRKAYKSCDATYRKCAKTCGKECVKDCRAREANAQKVCREDFTDTMCPIKGKEAKSCKEEAKAARRDCKKDADIKCDKRCK